MYPRPTVLSETVRQPRGRSREQTLATLGRKDGMDRNGSKLDVKLELRLQTTPDTRDVN